MPGTGLSPQSLIGVTDRLLLLVEHAVRLCIEVWDFFDACGVSSYGIWAGQRPPLGSSQAERGVINEG